MRALAPALAAILATIRVAAADPLDGHDCFSSDNDRRIAGCTELIERSGLSGQLLGSAYAMRALAYSLKGLYDTAIQDYNEAIRLIPDFAVALNNRAWAYFKSGRPQAGLPDVERSLELQPTSPHAYDNQGPHPAGAGQSIRRPERLRRGHAVRRRAHDPALPVRPVRPRALRGARGRRVHRGAPPGAGSVRERQGLRPLATGRGVPGCNIVSL